MQVEGSKTGSTCQCHCSCCHGDCCCCKSKGGCCKSLSQNDVRPSGEGFQSTARCRSFAIYVTVPVVQSSAQASDIHQAVEFLPVASKVDISALPATISHVAELNTGPPPGNLVVALHRWII
jgi:hypothetical protein